jgi:hypothetical protein
MADGYSIKIEREGGKRETLANWLTSGWNHDWLRGLISEGKAEEYLIHGILKIYKARAGDVIPIISNDDLLNADAGGVKRNPEAIANCAPDEILEISLNDGW